MGRSFEGGSGNLYGRRHAGVTVRKSWTEQRGKGRWKRSGGDVLSDPWRTVTVDTPRTFVEGGVGAAAGSRRWHGITKGN